jgi:hypothetical protein
MKFTQIFGTNYFDRSGQDHPEFSLSLFEWEKAATLHCHNRFDETLTRRPKRILWYKSWWAIP